MEARAASPTAARRHRRHVDRRHPYTTAAGTLIDVADVALKLAVECEGYAFHGNHARWKHDRRRTALLESLGWRVLTVTWEDVTRFPDLTVRRVADALRHSRGA